MRGDVSLLHSGLVEFRYSSISDFSGFPLHNRFIVRVNLSIFVELCTLQHATSRNKSKSLDPSGGFQDGILSHYFALLRLQIDHIPLLENDPFQKEPCPHRPAQVKLLTIARNNASLDCHMDEERKKHCTIYSEEHNPFGDTSKSLNDFRLGSDSQTPPKVLAKSVPSFASASPCDLVDDHGADTNDPCTALPAVADVSSRSMSRTAFTAFVRETTELGPTLNTSALMLPMISCEAKEMSELAGCLEVSAVTSGLTTLDDEGDKESTTQTTPGVERKARFRRPQVGDRSRFRPWGYI